MSRGGQRHFRSVLQPNEDRLVAGCMTGTSIDGLDVALVHITGRGLGMNASLAAFQTTPFGELGGVLRGIASGERMSAAEMSDAAWSLGELHADAIMAAIGVSGQHGVDLVCVHGQTVFHAPNGSRGRTWQMLQPAPIAARVGCPVVFDLRAMDVALGGQGAPITPLADWIMWRREHVNRAIVNLGGFANATILAPGGGPEHVRGFDMCACNHVLDAIARERLGTSYDADGAAAAKGSVDRAACESLARVLGEQTRAGRSLGSGDEVGEWIEATNGLAAENVCRSACEAIGVTIGTAIAAAMTVASGGTKHGTGSAAWAEEILLAGGGALNPVLAAAIARGAGISCQRLDTLGCPVQAREAACFAVLGALCEDGVPITLAGVTGVPSPAPVSGAWCLPPRAVSE